MLLMTRQHYQLHYQNAMNMCIAGRDNYSYAIATIANKVQSQYTYIYMYISISPICIKRTNNVITYPIMINIRHQLCNHDQLRYEHRNHIYKHYEKNAMHMPYIRSSISTSNSFKSYIAILIDTMVNIVIDLDLDNAL